MSGAYSTSVIAKPFYLEYVNDFSGYNFENDDIEEGAVIRWDNTAEKFRIESNNDFEETVRFSNVYNRCIGFDSSHWHCANDFSKNKEPRLTLIIFWYEIFSGQSGIQRKDMEVI